MPQSNVHVPKSDPTHLAATILNHYFGDTNKPVDDDQLHEISNNFFGRRLRAYEDKLKSRAAFSAQDAVMPIPVLHEGDYSEKAFLELSDNKRNPVVVKGLITNSQACKKWNIDYFKQHCGDTPLIYGTDGTQPRAELNTPIHGGEKPLRSILENIEQGGKNYINNIYEIFHHHPDLIEDLDFNHISRINQSLDLSRIYYLHLFFGGLGTGSSLHCAGAGNFFFNVYGRKRWLLINPRYFPYMTTVGNKDYTFAISAHDINNATAGDYILSLPRYEYTLDPGDVLFNPPWWWHAVRNETEYTIAVAVRDISCLKQAFSNNFLYTALSPYKYFNPVFINTYNWLLKMVGKEPVSLKTCLATRNTLVRSIGGIKDESQILRQTPSLDAEAQRSQSPV